MQNAVGHYCTQCVCCEAPRVWWLCSAHLWIVKNRTLITNRAQLTMLLLLHIVTSLLRGERRAVETEIKYADLAMFTALLLTLNHLRSLSSPGAPLFACFTSRPSDEHATSKLLHVTHCCGVAVAVIPFVCAVRMQTRVTQYVARLGSFACSSAVIQHACINYLSIAISAARYAAPPKTGRDACMLVRGPGCLHSRPRPLGKRRRGPAKTLRIQSLRHVLRAENRRRREHTHTVQCTERQRCCTFSPPAWLQPAEHARQIEVDAFRPRPVTVVLRRKRSCSKRG
jgi:hypothetical protein